MESFLEWLICENTVTQLLKTVPKEEVEKIQNRIKITIKNHFTNIPDDKLFCLVKWATYWIYQVNKSEPQPRMFHMEHLINETQDYLSFLFRNQQNIAQNKFNNPNYTTDNLREDSNKWHEQLKLKERKSADPGRLVIRMNNGFTWVSLDKGYCSAEAKSMGHCGNIGESSGDNIYSMRDSKGIPHLTFIVNNQRLGESKGFGNNKPEAKYHPQIVDFLLGTDNGKPIVQCIVGGGYIPQENFHFDDLSVADQQKVLAIKPWINNLFKYLKHQFGNNFKKELEELFNTNFEAADEKEVLIKSFDDLSHMIKWLKENTSSEINEVPDFEDFNRDLGYLPDLSDSIRTFKEEANKENTKLMEKIINKLKKKLKEEEEDSIEWACENEDGIADALRFALLEGYESGAESDALKSVINHFDNESDKNGFYIKQVGYKWKLSISIDNLEQLYKTQNNEEWQTYGYSIYNYIEFEYSKPYDGYQGFDEEYYNENLYDKLKEVLDRI